MRNTQEHIKTIRPAFLFQSLRLPPLTIPSQLCIDSKMPKYIFCRIFKKSHKKQTTSIQLFLNQICWLSFSSINNGCLVFPSINIVAKSSLLLIMVLVFSSINNSFERRMKNQNKALTIQSDYCHHISAQNYFLSPKMPVKDHVNAFRSTKTTFKPNCTLHSDKSRTVLDRVDLNQTLKIQGLKLSMGALQKMNLLKAKELHLVSHKGENKALSSCIHTRQTNPGYSRNTLGGVYTK